MPKSSVLFCATVKHESAAHSSVLNYTRYTIIKMSSFVIFTNDLTSHITDGKVVMYADDTQFIDSDEPRNVEPLKARIENTLDTALSWFTRNSLKINPAKTEFIVFKTQRKKIKEFTVRFSDHTLAGVTRARVLGVILDPALTWEHHISMVVKRCNHILVGMGKIRCKLPHELRAYLIETLVFPLIRYCACVWGGACAKQRGRLQKVVNFAVRIVTNLKKYDHVSEACTKLGWPSVDSMIEGCDVTLLSRLMSSEYVPPALADLIIYRYQVTDRVTRSSAAPLLQLPLVRTELHRKSFGYRALQNWNKQYSTAGQDR